MRNINSKPIQTTSAFAPTQTSVNSNSAGAIVGRDLTAQNVSIFNGNSSALNETSRKPNFRFNIPMPTKHFKGHQDLLKAVQDYYDNESNCRPQMVAIVGKAGIGKTQLAQNFASQSRHKFLSAAWIKADTEDNVLQSFLGLAKRLKIALLDQKDADLYLVKEVYHHIDREDYGGVLFIFDHAIRLTSEGADFGIQEYLPTDDLPNERYPYILITTQASDWDERVKTFQVQELTRSEQLTTGPQLHERIQTVEFIQAIASIVFTLIFACLFAQISRQTATGIFIASTEGLYALDLRTSELTALTNKFTVAVAVNQKIEKVYWAEGYSSAIMRSDFDGSGKEVLVPPTDDKIFKLAIDQETGKIYYARYSSHKIEVCNALGKNCAVVISDSSLVNRPASIALDSTNGFMYWGHRPNDSSPHSIVRAKLDGSNATIISTGFHDLAGITLDQPSSNVLYWIDHWKNTIIGSINVNGTNKRTILRLEGKPVQGLQSIRVDAKRIYYSNWKITNIQSLDKDSGKELRTVFSTERFGLFTSILKMFGVWTSVVDFQLFSDPEKNS